MSTGRTLCAAMVRVATANLESYDPVRIEPATADDGLRLRGLKIRPIAAYGAAGVLRILVEVEGESQ